MHFLVVLVNIIYNAKKLPQQLTNFLKIANNDKQCLKLYSAVGYFRFTIYSVSVISKKPKFQKLFTRLLFDRDADCSIISPLTTISTSLSRYSR